MAKKLFLGISLNTQQRQAISQLQEDLGDDINFVPIDNLHMTLAFLGVVSSQTQRKLEKKIAALHKPIFSITFDKLSYWQKANVICLTGEKTDKDLQRLAEDCQSLSSALHLHQSKQLFNAHITLAHKAHRLPSSIHPFHPLMIKANAIHLFESKSRETGVEYKILRSWLLH